MAMLNEGNRPQTFINLGTVDATKTYALMHATVGLVIHGVRVVALNALAASAANYLTAQLIRLEEDGTEHNVGTAVDTKNGVTKGAAWVIHDLKNNYDFELLAGETLLLKLTETGTVSWADVGVATDIEVEGV